MDGADEPRPQVGGGLYGYIPTLWICALFIALYSVSTIIHLAQAVRYRTYWMLVTAFACGLLEILGWAGRLWSSKNPRALNPFLMQIICTILGPTPLLAACFIIFGRVIGELGSKYSRLAPMLYTVLFTSLDLVSLVVQAVGGAIAAGGQRIGSLEQAERGGSIMLGGITLQLVSIITYSALMAEFFYRWRYSKPVKFQLSFGLKGSPLSSEKRPSTIKHKTLMAGLLFCTLCIFIRSVYREVELADGWLGRIIRTEVYFNVLDGAMVVLALYSFNFAHPGMLLNMNTSHSPEVQDKNTELKSIEDGERL